MRTKLTTMFLALALALTTITSAAALPSEQGNSVAGDNSAIAVQSNEDSGVSTQADDVYEVSLSWDDPTFNYNLATPAAKSWNTETHSYEFPSDMSFDGSWDKTSVTATVTNKSTTPMKVSSGLYSAADSATSVSSYKLCSTSDLTISLSGGDETLVKGSEAKDITCSLSGSDVSSYFAETGAITAVTGQWVIEFTPQVPVMAEKDTWYKGTTAKSAVTSITVVSSYQPTGEEAESWDASAAGDGSVMAYLNGTELTIAGNGSNAVFMNPNAYSAFANFTALTIVNNADVFDTSCTTNMAGLFNNCKALTTVKGLENWDTSLVTSMSGLFLYCGELTSVDLTNWKTTSLKHMSHMFLDNMKLTSVGDLSGWDTSNVLETTNMFYRCFMLGSVGDISGWDTSKVANMSRMFAMIGINVGLTKLDLSGWDTSNVTDMTSMFLGCHTLEVLNMANWDTTNVTKHDTKFNNVPMLREVTLGPKYTLAAELPAPSGNGFDGKWHDTVTGEAYTVSELTKVTRTEAVTYVAMSSTPVLAASDTWYKGTTAKSKITDITFVTKYTPTGKEVESWDASADGDGSVMCYVNGTSLTIAGNGSSKIMANEDSSLTFANFTAVTKFNSLPLLDTSNVTKFGTMARVGNTMTSMGMFSNCESVSSLDLSAFNTAKATDMRSMFFNCSKLAELDLTSFNTSNVSNMAAMFSGDESLTTLKISSFDTSNVNSMNGMFYNCGVLANLDVSHFDTSKVTNMYYMFGSCKALTSVDVSHFDTSSSTNMRGMFAFCKNLSSLDVSGFNTSNVTNMGHMFEGCSALNSLNVSGFDTASVTDMRWMFGDCAALTALNVSGFDTSKVTDMGYMFNGCNALTSLNVSNFDVSKVTDMQWLFSGCSLLKNLDVAKWNTASVINMSSVFLNCSALSNLNVSGWNTSLVKNMDSMFAGCGALTSLNLSGWDTSAVTNMTTMFENCMALTSLNVSGWDTSNVTNMNTVFHNCSAVTSLDLTGWSTAKVTKMKYMFVDCKLLQEVTLGKDFAFVGVDGFLPAPSSTYIVGATGKWCDTASGTWYTPAELAAVTRTEAVTYLAVLPEPVLAARDTWYKGSIGKETVTSITLLDSYTPTGNETESWDASEAGNGSVKGYLNGTDVILAGNGSGKIIANANSSYAFSFSKYGSETGWKTVSALSSVSGFGILDTSNVVTMQGMFERCSVLTNLDVSAFDTSKVTDFSSMFKGCPLVTSLDVSGFDTSASSDMNGMFAGCSSLTSLNVSGFDTSKVINMAEMFYNCTKLTTLDVSKFNTSNTTNMSSLFQGCSSLTSLDVSGFDTAKVTNMSYLFYGCKRLTSLDVSTFNTSKVTNMYMMFSSCSSLTGLDVTKFDTSATTSMGDMFSDCSKLAKLDVSGFNTSKVTRMRMMFNACSSLTSLDVTKFDTSAVTNMEGMFSSCSSLDTLDVSSFDTSKVTTMEYMFSSCSSLKSLDLSKWDTSNVTTMANMFLWCNALTNVDISSFNTTKVTDMSFMFAYDYKLSRIYASDLWNTDKVVNSQKMFSGCTSLKGAVSYNDSNANDVTFANYTTGYLTYKAATRTLSAADTWYKGETDKSVITSLSIVDNYVPSGTEAEVWDASAGGDGSVMAYLNGAELTLAGNGTGSIEANEDSSYAFAGFSNVTSVQGLDLLDVSKVTNMTGMFQNSFTADTSFVAAGTGDVATFEVSPAYIVNTLSIDLRGWDVSGVTTMSDMFSWVSATSINITGWNYENLENADGMFNGCADVKVIYLGNFDIGNKCSTEGIFDGTQAGKTGPTVYVASTDVKDNLVNSNDLQENTDEEWDNNLNPSQIIVNAFAGRSSNTQVMMLIPKRAI